MFVSQSNTHPNSLKIDKFKILKKVEGTFIKFIFRNCALSVLSLRFTTFAYLGITSNFRSDSVSNMAA